MKDIFVGFKKNPFGDFWFPYPNRLVMQWHNLKSREHKAIDYILRHTIGFHKPDDTISYEQFLHGVTNCDNGCGIKSSSTLSEALKGLINKGFISKVGGRKSRSVRYSLVFSLEDNNGLQNPNLSSLESKDIATSETKDTINNNSINTPQYIINNTSDKYILLEDIENEDLAEIASLYQVPISFVSFQLEKLRNYCGSTGKTYKDYKKALSNFVLNAIQKSLEDEKRNNRYRGVDASHIH